MPGEVAWSEPVPYRLLGGINQDDAEDSIGENEVVDSGNFLFERGMSFTRPGVVTNSLGSLPTQIQFAKSFRFTGTTQTIIADLNNTLWRLNADLTQTQLTGSGFAWGATQFFNACVYNNLVLVGNVTSTGTILVWDPTGTIYTNQLTVNTYRYLTSYFTRVIGAYSISNLVNGVTSPQVVGWSAPGDITTWSPTANAGAGFQILTDCPDDITGLGVINNVLVILRRSGIHVGFPTGSALPAFRFETFVREGPGCYFPSTAAWDNNMTFFVAANDVYTFDLSTIQTIGHEIRDELLNYLDNGFLYRGFMSAGTKSATERRMRSRYNLVPINDAPGAPHFVYDTTEKKWSKHYYNTPVRGGFYYYSNLNTEAVVLHDDSVPPNISTWDSTVACEAGAFILGKVMPVFAQEKDYRCTRVLLRHKNYGQLDGIKVTVYATQDNTRRSAWDSKAVNVNENEDNLWQRDLFSIDISGQDFQLRIDVPPYTKFATNFASLRFSEQGEFMGTRPT